MRSLLPAPVIQIDTPSLTQKVKHIYKYCAIITVVFQIRQRGAMSLQQFPVTVDRFFRKEFLHGDEICVLHQLTYQWSVNQKKPATIDMFYNLLIR